MRRVARRPTTQYAWEVASHGHQGFFPAESVHDLDGLQLYLVMWIGFYRDIYGMPPGERPSDEDIDDDRELDQWYKRRQDEVLRQQLHSGRDPGGGGYVALGEFHGRAWTPD